VRPSASLMLVLAKVRADAARNDRAVHRAADSCYDRMRLAVAYGFLHGRKALKGHVTDAAGAAHAVQKALLQSLPPALAAAWAAGANVVGPELRASAMRVLAPQGDGPHETKPPFALKFNATDPKAVAYAEAHAGELAKDISDTTREAIQDAVSAALDGDGIEAAREDILDAVGDDDRADMIARTEIMDAANEGQQAGWEEAVEAGLLPEDAQVVWIATAGACDDCADMDGETRDVNGDYDDADYADGPPAHPRCRCTEGIAS
jgi:hypothetical protein